MGKIILHPTDTSQWHALVNEAQATTRLILNESTESYLVFLLMRFVQTTQLLESIIAMDFLHSMGASGKRQAALLQEVGDKSLLFCGLFPGMASKRHVRLDYFSDLGKAAYLTVSELQQSDSGRLFLELSKQFVALQQILQAMRGKPFARIEEANVTIGQNKLH